MSFDWWHPERTATCFIIVTIVEIGVCFSWALDPYIIHFKFCLAAAHEL